jgi:hypothetical protein
MKAFDTAVLLSVLGGDASAKALLRRLRGVEIATTESNMIELGIVCIAGSERHRLARIGTLDRLRRKLTVLPIDAAGVREATLRLGSRRAGSSSARLLEGLGALEAYGCDELFTDDPGAIGGKWRFKVTRYVSRP